MTSDLSSLFDVAGSPTYQVLDCTLRDGGYRNDWHFPFQFCQSLVSSLASAQVPLVELGFRFAVNNSLLGPHAHTTDEYLDHLDVDRDTRYLVMINASDFAGKDSPSIGRALDALFPRSQDLSVVSGVRIATTLAQLDTALSLSQGLHARGYFTIVNLMQMSRVSSEDVATFGQYFEKSEVSALYLADTFGALKPDEVARSVGVLKSASSKIVGFHGHDNLGLALLNSLAAIREGAELIDGTLLGMGRGAGNLRTEEILLHAKHSREGQFADWSQLDLLLGMATGELSDLKRDLGWGYSPEFVASGFLNVHPNYSQELIERGEATSNSLNVLSSVSKSERSSFNGELLQNSIALSREFNQGDGSPNYAERVLILGPGDLTEETLNSIRGPIASSGYQILALNDAHSSANLPVSYRFIVNPASASRIDMKKMENGVTLVAPKPILDHLSSVNEGQAFEYISLGFKLSEEKFGLESKVAHGRFPIALNYVLASLIGSQVRTVAFAGFPGYQERDQRMEQVALILRNFSESFRGDFFSISSTKHPIPLKSPFGLLP